MYSSARSTLALLIITAFGVVPALRIDSPVTADSLVYHCGPRPDLANYDRPALSWTPDGSHILFSWKTALYVIDSSGLSVLKIAEISSDIVSDFFGLHIDPSPDSAKVVFTSCEYQTHNENRVKKGFTCSREVPVLNNYEVVISNIDATDQHRLTEDLDMDQFPMWSPGGDRIAFVSQHPKASSRESWGKIYDMYPDGTDVRDMTPTFSNRSVLPYKEAALHHRPAWSPNGEYIAFTAYEYRGEGLPRYSEEPPYEDPPFKDPPFVVYTVATDSLQLRRLTESWSEPIWSPDGQRIAFVNLSRKFARHGDEISLYTIGADGVGIREVSVIGRPWRGFVNVSAISWSPDGSHIMLTAYVDSGRGEHTVFVFGLDGYEVQRFRGPKAVWSPDGSRIAAIYWGPTYRTEVAGRVPTGPIWLYTMAADGSDRRDLVLNGNDGPLPAKSR